MTVVTTAVVTVSTVVVDFANAIEASDCVEVLTDKTFADSFTEVDSIESVSVAIIVIW